MSSITESYLVGLIGDGIATSLSPPMHEREGTHHGMRYLYRPVDVERLGAADPHAEAALLLEYGRRLGFNAFNVTHPYKQTIINALDDADDDARHIGAVNLVTFDSGRAIGHNTDFSGYVRGVRGAHPEADLSRVVQLGAGGAGSAIAYGLLHAGAARVEVIDLDADRATERASDLQSQFPDRIVVSRPRSEVREALAHATGFAHCTPVGMHLSPGLPIDPSWLRPSMWVSDVVYLPLDTELMRAAREIGCATIDGGRMVVGQAVDAFEIITGEPANRERVRAHFLELTSTDARDERR